jgi:pimeloyl-ACP methyl ester carboxylesterase
MLHRPVSAKRGPAVLFCNPFGDERKSSCLTMARLARHLARAGHPVLRFDYAGCGDSPGAFRDTTLSTRLADIRTAAGHLTENCSADSLCLLGLTQRALLAARAARTIENCRSLALLAPLQRGEEFVGEFLRRKRVREMITKAEGGTASAKKHGEVEDLDGYAVRPSVLEQLGELSFDMPEPPAWRRALVVQISFDEELRKETMGVLDALDSEGRRVTARCLVLPPFWSRIDITDASSLNRMVAEWLGNDVDGTTGC